MKYHKVVNDGFISVIGADICGQEISEQEFNDILSALADRPSDIEETYYMLEDISLIWKAFKVGESV